MSDFKDFLIKLHENLNILREREAKYAAAAPLELLNQIDDYEQAIILAEQAIAQDVPLDQLQAEFSGLNLRLDMVVFVAQEPPRQPFTGRNPYQGLRKFTETEAEFFFGRTEAIQTLVAQVTGLREKPTSPAIPELMAILGASGSGKSSLVRAGLIPALRAGQVAGSEQWPIKVILPGPRPLEALAEVFLDKIERGMTAILAELAQGEKALHHLIVEATQGQPDEARFILVIDQFEELFTLGENESERQTFLDQLLYACQIPRNRAFIILTMRADFYAKASVYKNLAQAITKNQMLVSPLTERELREAILLPAEAVGLELEKDLVQALVHDTMEAPGALPLLQHALDELFRRRDGNLLRMQSYQEIGGIRGGVAHRADGVMEQLTLEQQQMARRIFLRLIQPGEGTMDTRRRATFEEVLTQTISTQEVETVVQTLADANLLITNRNPETNQVVLDVAHEALIQEWPTLRRWVREGRQGLRIRQHLSQATRDWADRGQDEGSLYRGARLLEAQEWVAANRGEINPLEQTFLDNSIAFREREVTEKEAQRQRELETAQKLAEEAEARRLAETQRAEEAEARQRDQQKANTKLRQRAIWLAIAGVAALILAAVAVIFGVQANQNAKEIALKNYATEAELNFSQTTADPQVRVDYLVQLFDRPGYKSLAMKLFWKLPSQEDQLALFKIKDDRLVRVIKELYITLADVNWTGYTDPLLTAMAEALANLKEATPLKAELDQWQQARIMAGKGQYEVARAEYDKLIDLNGDNPATRYERAGVLAELSDDQAALADLDRVMALVNNNPSLAPTGQIEASSEFAAVEQVTWAVKRLIEVKPELGRVLNSSGSAYPHLQNRDLVLPPTMITDTEGITMVLVPAGPFEMGSNNGNSDERPVHAMTLAAFYIDQYEVTNAHFVAFLKDQGNQEEGGGNWLATDGSYISQAGEKWQIAAGYANHPVTGVSWYGAEAYCKWRKGRLPTEAEWEKAARGPDGRTYPWGQAITCKVANYWAGDKGCVRDTTAVGAYPTGVSPYGAYDMTGNVFEWVADWYIEKYYSNSPAENPPGPPNGDYKVLRGGSWRVVEGSARATYRDGYFPGDRYDSVGFRCAAAAP